MQRIILASQSPRREMLLKQLGLEFTSMPANIDEETSRYPDPTEAVRGIARNKAAWVAARCRSGLVLAADTIVVCDGQVLGKPVSSQDAYNKLTLLSGRSHEVVTGVCLQNALSSEFDLEHEVTRVFFRIISEEEKKAYIESREPQVKAGAYAIQERGAVFVDRIEGCYFNVVGLPLARVYRMLARQGIAIL